MATPWNSVPSKAPASTVVDRQPAVTLDDGRDSGSFADDLLTYTPVPTIILDAALSIQQASDSYLKISGVESRDFVIGKHASDLFSNCTNFPAHASASQAIQTAQSSGRSHQQQYLTSDNRAWTIRCIPIHRRKILRYFQMEFVDTTEEHRRRLELEERLYTNETFRILVETVKDYAIFMLDPNGNVATWNAGAQAFKGYLPSEIIGQHFSKFYGPEDHAAGKPARELRDALRDGRCEDEGW